MQIFGQIDGWVLFASVIGSDVEIISPVLCDIIPSNALKMKMQPCILDNRNSAWKRWKTPHCVYRDNYWLWLEDIINWLAHSHGRTFSLRQEEFFDNCLFPAFRWMGWCSNCWSIQHNPLRPMGTFFTTQSSSVISNQNTAPATTCEYTLDGASQTKWSIR